MPSTYEYSNKSNDWNDTANWGGGPPASGDTVRILQGDRDINLNMGQSAVDLASLTIGPNFRGSIGTPGTPLNIDSAIVRINAPYSKAINIKPVTVPSFTVEACNQGEFGVYVQSGTITDLIVASAGLLRLGSPTITNIKAGLGASDARQALNLQISAGATLTNLISKLANIRTESTFSGNTWLFDCTMDFRAASATLAALVMHGGDFEWNGKSSTITLAQVFGGMFRGTNVDDARTLTNAEVWPGGTIDLGGAGNNITVSNPIKKYGGRVFGTDSVTTYIEASLGGSQALNL